MRASFTDDLGNPESRTSPATQAVQAAAANTAPGVPRTLTATAGDGQVVLRWTEPASDGGETITRYDYRSKATSSLPFVSSDSWTSAGTSTTATVGSLTNATPYSFAVRAVTPWARARRPPRAPRRRRPRGRPTRHSPSTLLPLASARPPAASRSVWYRVRPALKAITVQAATADGTATAPGDYRAYSSTVALQPQQQRACFTVTLVDDAEAEGDETFTVTLSNPANADAGHAACRHGHDRG